MPPACSLPSSVNRGLKVSLTIPNRLDFSHHAPGILLLAQNRMVLPSRIHIHNLHHAKGQTLDQIKYLLIACHNAYSL